MIVALLCFLAFLIGSIPFGLVIGRAFFKTDIRQSGSGNIGTVNALRTLGKTGGALVLLLDVGKGIGPTLLAATLAGPNWAVAVAAASVLGHIYSPWLGFRGGKGVATALGTIIALHWPAAIFFAVAWLAIVAVTRYASLGSMIATLVGGAEYAVCFYPAAAPICYALFLSLIIAYAHRENIARLRAGSEKSLLARAGARQVGLSCCAANWRGF